MDTDGQIPQGSTSSDRVEGSRSSDKFMSHTDELLKRKKEEEKVKATNLLEQAKMYQQEAMRLKALREAVGISSNLMNKKVIEDLAGLANVLDLNQVDTSSYLVSLADSELSEGKLDDRQSELSHEKLHLEGSIQKSC